MGLKIVIEGWLPITGCIVFCVCILGLLYRIGNAIKEQTEFLKEDYDIDNISNDKN
jgi:hypothetical protein